MGFILPEILMSGASSHMDKKVSGIVIGIRLVSF